MNRSDIPRADSLDFIKSHIAEQSFIHTQIISSDFSESIVRPSNMENDIKTSATSLNMFSQQHSMI